MSILFYVFAGLAIGGAVGVVMAKSPVGSLLFMVTTLAAMAGTFVLLEAHFLAAIQIIVYAGAIMVLFLFVIMLLGAEELAGDRVKIDWQKPAAFVLGALLLAELATVIFFRRTVFAEFAELTEFGTPAQIGRVLFNDYLLPFEITAFLLLAAMIGAIVIARRVRRSSFKRES